jgi:hypothetical protein
VLTATVDQTANAQLLPISSPAVEETLQSLAAAPQHHQEFAIAQAAYADPHALSVNAVLITSAATVERPQSESLHHTLKLWLTGTDSRRSSSLTSRVSYDPNTNNCSNLALYSTLDLLFEWRLTIDL